MRNVSSLELNQVSGGATLGVAVSTVVVGGVTGGPVGIGVAVSGLIIEEAVEKLNKLVTTGEIT